MMNKKSIFALSCVVLFLFGCSTSSSQRTFESPVGMKVTSNVEGTWVGITTAKGCTSVPLESKAYPNVIPIKWKTTPAVFTQNEMPGKRALAQMGFEKTCFVVFAYKPGTKDEMGNAVGKSKFTIISSADDRIVVGGDNPIPATVHFNLDK